MFIKVSFIPLKIKKVGDLWKTTDWFFLVWTFSFGKKHIICVYSFLVFIHDLDAGCVIRKSFFWMLHCVITGRRMPGHPQISRSLNHWIERSESWYLSLSTVQLKRAESSQYGSRSRSWDSLPTAWKIFSYSLKLRCAFDSRHTHVHTGKL